MLWMGVGGIVLIGACLLRLRQLKARGEESTLAYCVWRNTLRSLIPLVAVIGLYYVAFAYVRFSNTVSLRTLIRIEDRLEYLRRLVERLGLSPEVFLIVLILAYGAVTMGMSRHAWRRLREGLKVYKSSTGLASGLLVLLTSFTLLGSLPGSPQLTVALKIARIREGYGASRTDVETKLAHQVTEEIFQRTYVAFPSGYRDSLDLPSAIATARADLSARYGEASTDYGIKDANVEDVLANSAILVQAGDAGGPTGSSEGQSALSVPGSPEPPGSTTLADVERARISLEGAPDTSVPSDAEGTVPVREIMDQLSDVLIAPGHAFLSDAFPQWRPVIDTVVSAMGGSFKDRLGRSVDRVMRSAVKGRAPAIAEQADELAPKAGVNISLDTLAKAQVIAASLQSVMADIQGAQSHLETLVNEAVQAESTTPPSLDPLPFPPLRPLPEFPVLEPPLPAPQTNELPGTGPEFGGSPLPHLPVEEPPPPPPEPPEVVIP